MWDSVSFIQTKEFLDGKPLKVTAFGKTWNTEFYVERYKNGQIALQLETVENGYAREDFCTLTACIPDVPLKDFEVIIKNWSENEDVAKAALESGYFTDTGKRVATGFVQAPIWEVDFNL